MVRTIDVAIRKDWRLAAGGWRLATGDWRLATGDAKKSRAIPSVKHASCRLTRLSARSLGRQASIKAEQHFAQLIKSRRERLDLTGSDKAERDRHGELCFDFGHGASRDRDKASKLARAQPVATLGNVGWNRHRSTSELCDEPKPFFDRKRSGHVVDLDNDGHADLPDI